MRPRIYPEYYITTNDGIRTQVDKSHFFNELKKYFPNPEEVLNKLEHEDIGVSAEGKYFSVIKK
jgi:hypothetical protein